MNGGACDEVRGLTRDDAGQHGRPVEWASETLLAGAPAALIHHAGAIYTLRVTRQNKLLLTK